MLLSRFFAEILEFGNDCLLSLVEIPTVNDHYRKRLGWHLFTQPRDCIPIHLESIAMKHVVRCSRNASIRATEPYNLSRERLHPLRLFARWAGHLVKKENRALRLRPAAR